MACETCGWPSDKAHDCAQYVRSTALDYYDDAVELGQPELVAKGDELWAWADTLSSIGEGSRKPVNALLVGLPTADPGPPSLDADLARIHSRESMRNPVVGVDAGALASAQELAKRSRTLALLLSNPRRSAEQTQVLVMDIVILAGDLSRWLARSLTPATMEGEGGTSD